ncbi:MAG: hypothetical protein PWP37_441 [Thermotogota bacterium]|nr:hypothetical protein [Thermotogota bacterium]MDK2864249.1 hypothetical protein [Thermotogota bacterium]
MWLVDRLYECLLRRSARLRKLHSGDEKREGRKTVFTFIGFCDFGTILVQIDYETANNSLPFIELCESAGRDGEVHIFMSEFLYIPSKCSQLYLLERKHVDLFQRLQPHVRG